MEIERKWMVTGWPEGLPLEEELTMRQGYISVQPTVRIREEALTGGSTDYILCFKSAGGLAREEIDAALDLLAGKAAPGFEAEDVVRSAAGEGFFPDAHGGPYADIALPHGKFLSEGQPLRPALHHPFAFDFHNASLFHAVFWHFLFIIT